MFRHSRVFWRTVGVAQAAGTRWQAAADGLGDSKTQLQFWKAGEFRVAALLSGQRGRSQGKAERRPWRACNEALGSLEL